MPQQLKTSKIFGRLEESKLPKESMFVELRVPDALIDTGATTLSMPQQFDRPAWFASISQRDRTMTASGVQQFRIYAAAQVLRSKIEIALWTFQSLPEG